MIYEITERMTDKHGQYLLEPEVEIDTWWTNLPLPDREIIELYHAHGECEQYHSEFKTDMDLERLPSEKFATNALVIELGMIAYNILRMIGQESLGIGVGQENLFIGMIHAFAYMGIPKHVLTDNMKSVVIRRDEQGHPIWQPDYELFMGNLCFEQNCASPGTPLQRAR